MRSRILVLVVAACLGASCSEQSVNLGGNYQTAAFIPPIENQAIDLLFVVDSSGSMYDNQMALAAKAQEALFDVIEAAIGGMPDLHVGVITPDMALGITTDTGCETGAEGGALQIGTCTGITDPYLIDIDDGAGGRITNYTGTLEEAFACIAQVGTDGCGFEQPMKAAAAAMTHPANAGFLRDDALLVVIMLTDEDDCSSDGTELFDPDNTAVGPLSSYRCFHEAVRCIEDLDSVGVKTECEARDDNGLLVAMGDIEAALVAAKGGDPSKVMVAAIAGEVEPVEVGMQTPLGSPDPQLVLLPSCVTPGDPSLPGGWAYPAIRLNKFLDLFPGRSWFDSICGAVDPSLALARTANTVGDIAGRRSCLRGALRDGDPDLAGIQPSCRVFLATAPFTAAEVRRELPMCGDGDTGCFRINAGSATCAHWSGHEVELVDAGQTAAESLLVECLVPETSP